MAILIGERRCGKTLELIKYASANQLYIICLNRQRVSYVSSLSKEVGLDIPFPVSLDELPLRSRYIEKVVVDDVEDVLSALIGKRVEHMTTRHSFIKMKSKTEEEGQN